MKMEPSPPYTNGYQRQVVEQLHESPKVVAVEAADNSEVHVYLKNGNISTARIDLGPYYISNVISLDGDSPFNVHVVISPDWSEVDDE